MYIWVVMKYFIRLLNKIKQKFRHKKPKWDLSDSGIQNPKYTSSAYTSFKSLDLWEAQLKDICKLIHNFEEIYGNRSWYRKANDPYYAHDIDKILKVINNWDKRIGLTPPVFMHNGFNDLLIYDGRHRFSTCVLFYKDRRRVIPFLIDSRQYAWVKKNMPSCKFRRTIEQGQSK